MLVLKRGWLVLYFNLHLVERRNFLKSVFELIIFRFVAVFAKVLVQFIAFIKGNYSINNSNAIVLRNCYFLIFITFHRRCRVEFISVIGIINLNSNV